MRVKPTDLLLFTAPLTQLNTPYPSVAQLTGYFRSIGFEVVQRDPSIDLFLRLFSEQGLERIKDRLEKGRPRSLHIKGFLSRFEAYKNAVESAVRFLQGGDPSLAFRIVNRTFLPEGPRFAACTDEELGWAFGPIGLHDKAKHLASLFIDDIADVIREGIDEGFELSRYRERLSSSQPEFEPLYQALTSGGQESLVSEMISEITKEYYDEFRPRIVGVSVPFPGNVFAAFKMASRFKALDLNVITVLGGGFVNTELRECNEPRVFQFFDYLTLDDGERPFVQILKRHLRDSATPLFRTLYLDPEGKVTLAGEGGLHDLAHRDLPPPVYDGLPLAKYVNLLEMLNPMHRLWSDGRWNKITLAHGCYWKKCNFCDVSLDYIGRYDPAPADKIVDRILAVVEQTGMTGFHFVDEAAPPALLRQLADRLLARRVQISWWGNVRFEKAFTPELSEHLAKSGCIAISGGLEVASDRLLKLMNKGVSVEQVAQVTRGFSDAGVMVHAYLMFGFPTQTQAETVDALERVRQLFEEGCIQSGFWHRFATTVHSPIGKEPKKFGITLHERMPRGFRFARNDVEFKDPTGVDHDRLGLGLKRALYNYMRGVGLDQDVRTWFEPEFGRNGVKRPDVPPDLVSRALKSTRKG